MTQETFLSARWNNGITFGLGLLFFSFIAIALFTTLLSVENAFQGLVLIGCLF